MRAIVPQIDRLLQLRLKHGDTGPVSDVTISILRGPFSLNKLMMPVSCPLPTD